MNDSIYRDIDYIEGLSLNLKELSDVVNINGYLVGLDKIGHFFAQGWQYFELTDRDKQTLDQATAWGRQKEAGLFGYTMRRSGFPLITVVMGFILGPLVERAFLQTLQMSDGDYSVFFTRPVSAVLVMLCVFVLLFSLLKGRRGRQERMST